MYTLGFPFRPWTGSDVIASGNAILTYIKETAHAFQIDQHIRYKKELIEANWITPEKKWNLSFSDNSKVKAKFVMMCSGYYDYGAGYEPTFRGRQSFLGKWIHPQHWPSDLEMNNKDVVIIGSGATAITLFPNLARMARYVTILQRSPGYLISMPSKDPISLLHRILPPRESFLMKRTRAMLLSYSFYYFCKMFPRVAKSLLRFMTAKQLPSHVALDPHFHPSYNPWGQRLCLVPDGDFFEALHSGKASIVTSDIRCIEEDGIRLTNDEKIHADIIISATGLKMKMAGGTKIFVDDTEKNLHDCFIYKGTMLTGLPNFSLSLGYTNASWTLGADLAAQLICRLLSDMQKKGISSITPNEPTVTHSFSDEPLLDLCSNYVQRAQGDMPRSSNTSPWRARSNYFADVASTYFADVSKNLSKTYDM